MSYEAAFTNQPVVIDNGSGSIKAGIAGEEQPKVVVPTFVGRPKYPRVMAGAMEGDTFIDLPKEESRGLLKLRYPMEHGVVREGNDTWQDMEKLWTYLYSHKKLDLPSEEHPVLLTETPLNPRKNRERTAEIFFENFSVPALYFSMQAVLSLYATGKVTGVVVDCGDGVTTSVPIFDGFAVSPAIMRSDIGGRDVTRQLQLLLRKEGLVFKTSAELEIVRTIKERACFVAFNPHKEEQLEVDRAADQGNYVLPDGRRVQIGAARFRAPEVLFSPELMGEESEGVHEVLMYSIQKADQDLRKTLLSNIVLVGGSSLFEGFGQRLASEVKRLAPKDTKIRIDAPRERKYSTWIGGSLLAALETFKTMWVSKKEYDEEGAKAVNRKTFV